MDRIVGAPASVPRHDPVGRVERDDNQRGYEPEPDPAPAIPSPTVGGVLWR